MNVDRNEVLRYLGWRGQDLDARTENALQRMCDKCLEIAVPRSTYRKFGYENGVLKEADLKFRGFDVIRHLEGSKEVYLFAATIGSGIEKELERLYSVSRADALILDAAASACIESYVDECCIRLEAETQSALLPRFSCGYGDFPIDMQNDICALLSTDTRIGLCADVRHTLSPLKSVTAVIGVLDRGKTDRACINRCALCNKKECAFRK